MSISIIMPAYNNEKHIALAISSILLQDHRDWELIIVNDASSDKTPAIINKFAKNDQRVKIINHHENQGRAISRNNAIMESTGEILSILDADDMAMPNRLSLQCKIIMENKTINLIGSGAIRINSRNNIVDMVSCDTEPAVLKESLIKYQRMPFVHSSVSFRRSALCYAGLYDKKFIRSQDVHFCRKIASQGVLYGIPEPLAIYRLNESITAKELRIRHKYSSYVSFDGFLSNPRMTGLLSAVKHRGMSLLPGYFITRLSGLQNKKYQCSRENETLVENWIKKLEKHSADILQKSN